MDPNANLRRQEYLLDCRLPFASRRDDQREIRAELAQLRGDLKGWLRAGGFAPDWAAAPLARRYFRR